MKGYIQTLSMMDMNMSNQSMVAVCEGCTAHHSFLDGYGMNKDNKTISLIHNKITIDYKGNLKKIKVAVDYANAMLRDPKFYECIKSQDQFDMADTAPATIADMIYKAEIHMRVVMYISSPRVHGYDDPFNSDLIHINVFRNDWTISGIVNTIIHQIVHAVNEINPPFRFGHGDKCSEGKQNTAPYWIANCAEELITGHSGKTGLIHEAPPESLALDTIV